MLDAHASHATLLQGEARELLDTPTIDHDVLPAIIGPFKPVARIGRGGMGVVYGAWDEARGRHVAVKCLHPNLVADPEVKRMCALAITHAQEAQIVAEAGRPKTITIASSARIRRSRSSIRCETKGCSVPASSSSGEALMRGGALERRGQGRNQ